MEGLKMAPFRNYCNHFGVGYLRSALLCRQILIYAINLGKWSWMRSQEYHGFIDVRSPQQFGFYWVWDDCICTPKLPVLFILWATCWIGSKFNECSQHNYICFNVWRLPLNPRTNACTDNAKSITTTKYNITQNHRNYMHTFMMMVY